MRGEEAPGAENSQGESLGTLDDFIKMRNDFVFEILDSGRRFHWLECEQLRNENAASVHGILCP